MAPRERQNNRGRILDAARQIIEARGTAHLTIEAVAEAAELSKGGVLYHYGSKKALLVALRDAALEDLNARYAEVEPSSGAFSAWLSAHRASTAAPPALGAAMLANAAEDPELLAPLRDFVRGSLADITREAEDPDLGRLLFLAVLGLRFDEMFGLVGFSAEELGRLEARLEGFAQALGT